MDDPRRMTLVAELPIAFDVSPGSALVAAGAVTLYVASRAAADALAGSDPGKAGLRALGHCLPIAIVALLCLRPSMGRPGIDPAGIGRPQMAVGMLFANGVACVTLLLGIVTYLAPLSALPPSRKVWPFVLPAAMLALVAGFNGALNWLHAGMLLVLGGAVMNLWLGPSADEPVRALSVNGHDDDVGGGGRRRKGEVNWANVAQLALALLLSAVGGWALTRGAARLEQTSRVMTGVVLAGTVMAPLLALPVLGTCTRLTERGHGGSAVSTLVAIVLINVCAIIPIVVIAHYVISGFVTPPATAELPGGGGTGAFPWPGSPVTYPLISWRIDTVVLAVAGLAMIPWAIGRWTISRAESVALIFSYAVYLALVAILSRRWN
jgi:Ca2+/Na+ antiporter